MTALLTACLFFEILVHVLQKHARKAYCKTWSGVEWSGFVKHGVVDL